ncbi:MAG: PQQ-binding-like beta-propeller repeat protein [Planctomycetales bacterium]|nr:PQQ-binding-like beta-propeller repeat protein [Planctomycetales bacterium]
MNPQPFPPAIARLLVIVVSLAAIPLGSAYCPGNEPAAEKWTRFRGENGAGILEQCNVPLPWQPSDVAWELNLPGKGNGSPTIYGDQAFVMSAHPDTAERYLIAVDVKTGQELWRKSYPSHPHHLHARSSYASCTPCVNGSAVFFAWGSTDGITLVALSHGGEELWRRVLGPSYPSQHGFGASPVLFGNTLVLMNSQNEGEGDLPPGVPAGQSSVMAFDSQTGESLWTTPRTTTRVCYGAPAQFKDASGVDALLFCNTGDGIFALSLDDGKPLWNSKVFVKRCVSSPIIVGDLAIGTEGSGGGGNILYGVDLHGTHEVKLKIDRAAAYVPTPVAKGDLLFLWGDKGIVTCVRASQGEVLWSKRIGGNVSSSPVIAGDKLLGIAEDGTLTVLAASEKFEELGSVKLEETTRAVPALHPNFILIRTQSRLLCVGHP